MGDDGEAGGSFANGMLPGALPVMREIDVDRWLRVEKRSDQLIACIQPTQRAEDRRKAVQNYVKRIIENCFPCQVFIFGSVPLKTYLPDGDIDLTVFPHSENMKDTCADQVRDLLESEEKNEDAEFRVKEVQYIQAEVKIVKCLVENIVVDISFNQHGGLCTLCFLEQVDTLISQKHLFKRSIILIKAWCYYESRILGAHHGLISTYALETLVLYIFVVYNKSFHGPLEVLFRFLEFFSNFDWDNFCLSLWGPVPISSLPDVTAEHPRKDGSELVISRVCLDACRYVYSVYPAGQEINGQPFISKHFNVIDPLRFSNNLGRSVGKGNFFRIRSAFAFGAKKLARLLDCPKEELIFEVNQFFMNTWERHGSGHRPDAPGLNSWHSGLSNPDHLQEFSNTDKITREGRVNGYAYINKMEGDRTRGSGISSKQGKGSGRMVPIRSKSTAATPTHNLKSQFSSLMISDQSGKQTASPHDNEAQRDLRADHLVNETQGRTLFSRIHSSPELTDECDSSSQPRRGKVEAVNAHNTNGRLDSNNRKNNLRSESLSSHSRRSSVEDNSSIKDIQTQQSFDVTDINENSYRQKFGVDTSNDKFSSSSKMIQQDKQVVPNMLATASLQNFNCQHPGPFNFPPGHLPIPHPYLLSMAAYGQRNLHGFLPFIDQSFPGMQLPQGLVSSQMTPYLSGTALNMTSEDPVDRINENFGSVEMNSREAASDLGQETGSPQGFDTDNGNFDELQSNNKPAASSKSLYIPPFRSHPKVQQKHSREKGGSMGKNIGSLPNQDLPQRRDIRSSDVYAEERSTSSRLSSASHTNSMRSRTSSESSWDGSVKLPKSTKEKRGKKVVPTDLPVTHGKGKIMSEHAPDQASDGDQVWGSSYSVRSETAGRNPGSEPVASLQVRGHHHMPDSEVAQTSESMPPLAPMVIGHDSREKTHDSNGLIAFYPTGPPIPFVAMVPYYNVPPENSCDASRAHFGDDPPSNSSIGWQNFSSRRFEQAEDLHYSRSLQETTTIEPSEEREIDILDSDLTSHWQNLTFARFCQQPRYPGPSNFPPPVMVPPAYLQGQFPYDNTGRSLSTNSSMFSELVSSYVPRAVPVSPQSSSARPPNVYQQYVDEMPRHRSGTGTYLPDPVTLKERQSSVTRRGNYNHDRNDNYGDREGSWNSSSRSRGAARSHGRTQTDRSNTRTDRLGPAEGRAERAWGSLRHDSTSYRSEDGPQRQNGPENLSYRMYSSAATNHNGISNGHAPPVRMTYNPFDQNGTYDPRGEQLEFDSLSPSGFSGTTEELEPNEGTRSRTYEDHRVNRNSRHRFSPDLPSSPRHQRRI